jgi:hypothetical protein
VCRYGERGRNIYRYLPSPRLATQYSLLAVLKVLLNLTHDSELGTQRVGEQRDLMANIFRVILHVRSSVC